MVVQQVKIDRSNTEIFPIADQSKYFNFSFEHDKLHSSLGAGLRIALNENFVLRVDYGFATNKQDGLKSLYLTIGNLF